MSYHSAGLNPIVDGTLITGAWMENQETRLDAIEAALSGLGTGGDISGAPFLTAYKKTASGVTTYYSKTKDGTIAYQSTNPWAVLQSSITDTQTVHGYLKLNPSLGTVPLASGLLISDSMKMGGEAPAGYNINAGSSAGVKSGVTFTGYGIDVTGSTIMALATGVTLENFALLPSVGRYGIALTNVGDYKIRGVATYGGDYGLIAAGALDGEIVGNCFSGASYGMNLNIFHNNYLAKNIIDDNINMGTWISLAGQNTWISNLWQSNNCGTGHAIGVGTGLSNHFINNYFENNACDDVIHVYDSSRATSFSKNYFGPANVGAHDCVIYNEGTHTEIEGNEFTDSGAADYDIYSISTAGNIYSSALVHENTFEAATNKVYLASRGHVYNNTGINPIGKLDVASTGFGYTSAGYYVIGYAGHSSLATYVGTPNNRDFHVINDCYITSSGGTGVSIDVTDAANNSLIIGASTLTAFPLKHGYVIRFGACTVNPTVLLFSE
jgi:hypothetical protein